jgi:hypothetical protein
LRFAVTFEMVNPRPLGTLTATTEQPTDWRKAFRDGEARD